MNKGGDCDLSFSETLKFESSKPAFSFSIFYWQAIYIVTATVELAFCISLQTLSFMFVNSGAVKQVGRESTLKFRTFEEQLYFSL